MPHFISTTEQNLENLKAVHDRKNVMHGVSRCVKKDCVEYFYRGIIDLVVVALKECKGTNGWTWL